MGIHRSSEPRTLSANEVNPVLFHTTAKEATEVSTTAVQGLVCVCVHVALLRLWYTSRFVRLHLKSMTSVVSSFAQGPATGASKATDRSALLKA